MTWTPFAVRTFFVVILGLCVSASSFGADPASLARSIDAMIDASPFSSSLWGILIEEEGGDLVYRRNDGILMVPASVRKIFLAAAVLDCESILSAIETPVRLEGGVDGSILRGDLVIDGMGDPSIAGRWFDDRDIVFMPVLEALRERGIKTISGSVVGNAARFDRESIPGGWKNDNLGEAWAAPVDALAFNENVLGVFVTPRTCGEIAVTTDPPIASIRGDLRCGAEAYAIDVNEENAIEVRGEIDLRSNRRTRVDLSAVRTPALWIATALDDFLRRHGVVVGGAPRTEFDARAEGEVLARLRTVPLSMIAETMLTESANLYSEMLYKRLSLDGEFPASYESSREREAQFLTHVIGVDGQAFSFEDGSGLSVEDYVTPAAVMTLLRYISDPARRSLWEMLLAAPGRGTLKKRLASLGGRLWGKTGSLDGVNSLAGWMTTKDGYRRRFVIMVNNHVQPGWKARDLIDRIVVRIAEEKVESGK